MGRRGDVIMFSFFLSVTVAGSGVTRSGLHEGRLGWRYIGIFFFDDEEEVLITDLLTL